MGGVIDWTHIFILCSQYVTLQKIFLKSELSICDFAKNISRIRALNMRLCKKYFSNPSLVICLFATPLIKLQLTLQIDGRLVIANHLD
jgi:hypothetical protein